MIAAGLDIGSRTIALVEVENGRLMFSALTDTTYEPLEQCRVILSGRSHDRITATGYGRHLAREHFAHNVITEIKAFARGSTFLFPRARTVLDIGGQDTKAILLSPRGDVADFQMNDRCAAGTGKFMEVMASALHLSMDDLWRSALSARQAAEITSFCTVFAESEVTGLIARNTPRDAIARGLHEAMCERALALLKRVGIEREVVFAGGVALNGCVRALLEERLGFPLLVPENPQIVGALGAALSAFD